MKQSRYGKSAHNPHNSALLRVLTDRAQRPHETQETMHFQTQSDPSASSPFEPVEVPSTADYRTDFPVPDRPIAAATPEPIAPSDQVLGSIDLALPSRAPAYARVLGTAQPIGIATSEEAPNPCGSAANDDTTDGPVQVKRTYQRRKPIRDDRRRNTTSLTIPPRVYDQARTAFANAAHRGLPLDTMLTLRPRVFETLTPEERHAWTKKRLNALRQLFADNDNLPEFAALWSRESVRVRVEPPYGAKGEHIHLLVHTAGAHAVMHKALLKSFGRYEADVGPADDLVRRLDNGQLGDASTYLLKAVHQNVWRTYPATPHRPSGEIYGPRVGWTRNILDEQPVRRTARRAGS